MTTISGAGAHESAGATDRIPASKEGTKGYLTPAMLRDYILQELTPLPIDDDTSLGGEGASDESVPSQAAVKAYVDSAVDAAADEAATRYAVRPETFGALSDARFSNKGSSTDTDNTFTDSTANFGEDIVGQGFIAIGIGESGATLVTTVASRNSSTSIELTDAPSATATNVEYAHWTTDDTAALQAALDSIPPGGELLLQPGRIYPFTNLVLPHTHDDNRINALRCDGGMAMLLRIPGGDDSYAIAPARWLSGNASKAFPSHGWTFENLFVEGAFLSDRVIVTKQHSVKGRNCVVRHGLINAWAHTRRNQDDTDGSGSSVCNASSWFSCRIVGGGSGAAFISEGKADNEYAASTDNALLDTHFDANGSPYSIDLGNAGGWTVERTRCFDATTCSLRVRSVENVTSIQSNQFEEGGLIERINYDGGGVVQFGGGNNWWKDLVVQGADNANVEVLVVNGDHFSQAAGGGAAAQLVLNTAQANKTLIAIDCTFRASAPLVRSNAGTLRWEGGVAAGGQMGRGLFDDGSASGPNFRGSRRSASPANNDNLSAFQAYGNNASAAEILYAELVGAIFGTTVGAENGAWLIRTVNNGALATRFVISNGLAFSGGADPGAGSANFQNLYINGTRRIDSQGAWHAPGFTATQIGDAANSVNLIKAAGKTVRDTTNNRLMVARGSGATDQWDVVDGSASVTPA